MPYIAFFYCHVRPAGVFATVAFQVRAPAHLLAAATGPPLAPVRLARSVCWHPLAACGFEYGKQGVRSAPGGLRAVAPAALPRAGQHRRGLLLAHPDAARAGAEPAPAPGRRRAPTLSPLAVLKRDNTDLTPKGSWCSCLCRSHTQHSGSADALRGHAKTTWTCRLSSTVAL